MRVRGNQQPAGAFNIYPQPDKAGFVCVRFFENAHKVKVSVDEGEPIHFWEYDEYELIIPNIPNLAADIEVNYDRWLLTAKSHSPDATHTAEVADLRQAVEILSGVDISDIEAFSIDATDKAPFTAFAESTARARGAS